MDDWELRDKLDSFERKLDNLEYDLRKALRRLELDIKEKANKFHTHSEE